MYISIEKYPGVSTQKYPVFQLAIVCCCYRRLCIIVTENWLPAYTVQLIAFKIAGGTVFRPEVVAV